MEIILTSVNGQRVVTNKDRTYQAQPLRVEEAFSDGLSLQDAIDNYDGFMEDWMPIQNESGWGSELEKGAGNFTILE